MNRREFIKKSVAIAVVSILPAPLIKEVVIKATPKPVDYLGNLAEMYGITRKTAGVFSGAETDESLRKRCLNVIKGINKTCEERAHVQFPM